MIGFLLHFTSQFFWNIFLSNGLFQPPTLQIFTYCLSHGNTTPRHKFIQIGLSANITEKQTNNSPLSIVIPTFRSRLLWLYIEILWELNTKQNKPQSPGSPQSSCLGTSWMEGLARHGEKVKLSAAELLVEFAKPVSAPWCSELVRKPDFNDRQFLQCKFFPHGQF